MGPDPTRYEQHDFGKSVGVDEVEKLLMNVPLEADAEVGWDLNLSVCSYVEPGAGFRLGNALRRWGVRFLIIRIPDPGDFSKQWFLNFTRSGIGLALSAAAGQLLTDTRDVTDELREYYAAKGDVSGENYGVRTAISTGALTPDEERFGRVFMDLAGYVQLKTPDLTPAEWRGLISLVYEAVLNVVDHAFKGPWHQQPGGNTRPLSYFSLRRYKTVTAESNSHGGLREYLRRAEKSADEDRQGILKWIELVVCDNGVGIAARQSQRADIYGKPIDVEDEVLREALAAGGSIKLKSRDAAVHGDPGYGLSTIAGELKRLGAYAALRTGRRLVELDSTLDSAHFEVRKQVLGWMPGTALHIIFPVRNPQLHLQKQRECPSVLRCLAPRREDMLFEEPFGESMVALFDPRMERSIKTLLNRIRDLDLVFDAVDLLVLRGSEADFVAEVESEGGLPELIAGIPLMVLCGSHDKNRPDIRLVSPSWASTPGFPVVAENFREPEMRTLLRRSRAVYKQDGVHYQLPSAAVHAEAFIRLADALQDHTDLVRLADWILPLLSGRSALAADTGSLLGLLATVRNEALRRFGWNIPIATLDEYPRSAATVDRSLGEFEATRFEHLVFLVSVSSTGSVARQVRWPQPDATIVSLVETATEESAAFSRDNGRKADQMFARFPVQRWPLTEKTECEECRRRKTFYIDPETYTIRADLEWKPEGLDLKRIVAEAPFWATADRADAVALHVQQPLSLGAPQRTRHLAVSLDVARLLADGNFRSRCRQALDQHHVPRPDVVIIPEHAATDALASLAVEHFRRPPTYGVPVDRLPEAVCNALRAARRVLVMDDVLITGQTLFGLRTQIFKVAQERHSDIDVWAFVAVSRPGKPDDQIAIRQRFSSRPPVGSQRPLVSHLVSGFELLLPPPGDEHCPWCRERRLLERAYGTLNIGARLIADARLAVLRAFPLLPPLSPWGTECTIAPRVRSSGSFGRRPRSRPPRASPST